MASQHGFTLAEVLITLGIIGVVAAMTMPTLIANHQKKVLQNQYKKSYSLFQQAARKAEADLDYRPDCFYWHKSPYDVVCVDKDKYGNCLRYEMTDGSPAPTDKNGRYNECGIYMSQIEKNLKIIKTCRGNAYANGCIPDYEGNDTLKKISDDTLSDEDVKGMTMGCGAWNKNQIKNDRTAYVLADGSIILLFSGPQLFAIDVNGKKGPNKWGHDIFSFMTKSDITGGLQILPGMCEIVDKNGMTSQEMWENSMK